MRSAHLLTSVSASAITAHLGGGGIGPISTVFVVTVPSGITTTDLVDFPIMVDLSGMPSDFWASVSADGGNIRAYDSDGVTPAPFDITYFDTATASGRIFVKKTITSASDTVFKIALDGAGLLPVTDPYGRNAVWSDYEIVFVFPEFVNRTGLAYPITNNFTAPMTEPAAHHDWALGNFNRLSVTTGVAPPTSWTCAASVYMVHTNPSDYRQGFLSMAVGANHNNRETLTYDWGPSGLLTWNSTDGRMNWPNNPPLGTTFRAGMLHDGTTIRKGFYDGVNSVSDAGVAIRPIAGSSYDFVLNAVMVDNFYVGKAWYQYVWLRAEAMSDSWMAADAGNMNSPSTFYSIVAE